MHILPYEPKALFEHLFWLQILGDHGRLLFNNLSPKETPEVEMARSFIVTFDTLLTEARNVSSAAQISILTQEAFQQANAIRNFKLYLIKQQLVEKIALHFPPTFVNHMVNEVEEYLRILQYLQCGKLPPLLHPIHHELLWLPDAAGHAGAIANGLDGTEQSLIEKSDHFTKQFNDLFIKATEMRGYLRTGITEFPALDRFNNEISEKMSRFIDFLCYIKDYIMKNQVLSALTELVPDHMLREECYFLTKLAEVSVIAIPPCDPAWPRPEE